MRNLIAALTLLCATAQAGEPQESDDHLGRYEAVFVDDDAAHRAAGHGGSGKKVRARIEIARERGALTARYSVAPAESLAEETTAILSEVTLKGDRFSAAPIAVKSAWPLYLPISFDGRFEGRDALVIDGHRYRRIRR